MKRTRIKLDVYVDLDLVPGTFYTKESAQNAIQTILNGAIPHYNPVVHIAKEEK